MLGDSEGYIAPEIAADYVKRYIGSRLHIQDTSAELEDYRRGAGVQAVMVVLQAQ